VINSPFKIKIEGPGLIFEYPIEVKRINGIIKICLLNSDFNPCEIESAHEDVITLGNLLENKVKDINNVVDVVTEYKDNSNSLLDIKEYYKNFNPTTNAEKFLCFAGYITNILKQKNIEFFSGSGTFYLWCKVPPKLTTDEFCEQLINNYGIVVTPGYCFGKLGDGYFRIALTKSEEQISNCLNMLKKY